MTVFLAAAAVAAACLVAAAPGRADRRLRLLAGQQEGDRQPETAGPGRPRAGRSWRHRRDHVDTRSLALALELVAACLSAGQPLAEALQAVATGLGPPMALRLSTVAAALRTGAAPREAWAAWLADERLAPVARALVRAGDSGAPVAVTVLRAAGRARAAARADAEQAARAVGVWAVLPLGVCFLPAFVLVGVAPAVIAMLREVL